MENQMSKKKRLTAGDGLIRSTIFRQSGTLAKAILEGVMNSVDAKASRIAIVLGPKRFTIEDDGEGFRSEDEIDRYFSQLGEEHELDEDGVSTDAIFGTFRIGRGQMFAKGVNDWYSNGFHMRVDAKKSLEYDFSKVKKARKGCLVEVRLYTEQSSDELFNTEEDLERMVRYVKIPVLLNGKPISHDPAGYKWDVETDDAWIKVDTKRSYIEFYQQGVLVEHIHSYSRGYGGVVVTKKPVPLNLSRNEIMRDSAVWRRISAQMKKMTDERLERVGGRKLSRQERGAVLEQLLEYRKMRERGISCHDKKTQMIDSGFATAKIFEDVSGQWWSAQNILRASDPQNKKRQFDQDSSGKTCVAFGPACSSAGDKAMQQRRGLVLREDILSRFPGETTEDRFKYAMFGHKGPGTACSVMGQGSSYRYSKGGYLRFCSLEELGAKVSSDYRIVPDNELRESEKRIQSTIEASMWYYAAWYSSMRGFAADYMRHESLSREIYVGTSSHAAAWTDGSSFVAFNRSEINKGSPSTYGFWVRMAALLCHEMAHDSSSASDTHAHTPEFYKAYHDFTLLRLGDLASRMAASYRTKVSGAAKRKSRQLTRAQERELEKEMEYLKREKQLEMVEVAAQEAV
jgi:hypothetical protein